MKPRKSAKARLAEGRGTGIGPNYSPFIKVEEARSNGTATRLYDAQQGRSIHTLSRTELSFYLTSKYFFAKCGNPILYVFEQYPLDMDDVRRIRRELGFSNTPASLVYTTDFVFELQDRQRRAYSIKSSLGKFEHRDYPGNLKEKTDKLEIRQEVERRYWSERNIPFAIVTGEALNPILYNNV